MNHLDVISAIGRDFAGMMMRHEARLVFRNRMVVSFLRATDGVSAEQSSEPLRAIHTAAVHDAVLCDRVGIFKADLLIGADGSADGLTGFEQVRPTAIRAVWDDPGAFQVGTIFQD